VYSGLAALLLLIAVGFVSIDRFIAHERERDLHDWQVRLGLIADYQYDGIGGWVEGRFSVLQELADNGSLQLYMTQLLLREQSGDTEPAQLTYLRNLLLATAERGGYSGRESLTAPIRANIVTRSDAGLALFGQAGNVIVATPGLPQLDEKAHALIREVLSGGRGGMGDIRLDEDGRPLLTFAVPVRTIQSSGEDRHERVTGVVVGIENVERGLYPLLRSRNQATRSDETLLVRQDGDSVVYLGPLLDGTPGMKRRLAMDTPQLASAYGLQQPGGFAQLRDYAGNDVLALSRRFEGLPWTLVQKIDAGEALHESDAHQRFLVTTFSLAMLFFTAVLVAAWRHGSSVKEKRSAEELQARSQQLALQAELLQGITDNITDHIFMVDAEGRLTFADGSTARAVGVAPEDLAGKTLASVFGPDVGERIAAISSAAITGDAPQKAEQELEIGGRSRRYDTTCVPVAGPSRAPVALVVLHDVTELQAAHHRQAELMQSLIRTLMKAIDIYDPYCVDHSARTAVLAQSVGRELRLGEQDLEALELAAHLANIGKLFIPKEVLTKTGALSDEEQQLLRQHVEHSVEVLSGLEFSGPVVETIAQKHESIDGSGYPKGLKGDEILLTARILAAANAFVAMVSPRAYREGRSAREALDELLKEADRHYDRHVVAALFHVVENAEKNPA